jgi:hypothetical protein
MRTVAEAATTIQAALNRHADEMLGTLAAVKCAIGQDPDPGMALIVEQHRLIAEFARLVGGLAALINMVHELRHLPADPEPAPPPKPTFGVIEGGKDDEPPKGGDDAPTGAMT